MISAALFFLATALAPAPARAAERFDYENPAFWSMVHVFPYRYDMMQLTVESEKPEEAAAGMRKAFAERGISPERVEGDTTYFVVADTGAAIHLLDSFGTLTAIVHEDKKVDRAELYFKREWLQKEKSLVAGTLNRAVSIAALVDVELGTLDALIARHEEAARGVGFAVRVKAPGQDDVFPLNWPSPGHDEPGRPFKSVRRVVHAAPGSPGGGMFNQPQIENSFWSRRMVGPPCLGGPPEYLNVTYEAPPTDRTVVELLHRLGAIDNPPSCTNFFAGGVLFWLEAGKVEAFQKKATRMKHFVGWQRARMPLDHASNEHNAEKQKLLSGELKRFARGLRPAPHIVAFVKAEINRLGGGGPGEIATRGRMPVVVYFRPRS